MLGVNVTDPTPPLILHVIHHLVVGGMENGLINLINTMPESSFRHVIVCVEDFSDFRQRLVRSDTKVIALHRSRIGIMKLRTMIFHLCRNLRPMIVHSRNMSGLDALLPARIAGVKYCVHSEHGWDIDNLNGEKWKPAFLRRLHSPLINHYITVSKHLENYLSRKVGISASRITQIYNGVDTNRFRPARPKSLNVLPPNFADENSIVFGNVGRIQAIKDQKTLVHAFAALSQSGSDIGDKVRLIIVGDGPLFPALHDLVDSLGIKSKTWMPNAISNVQEVMQAMDVFVLPSLSEGISNTILEAMASGLPVIATAVGGNLELVEEKRTGSFFNPGDIQSLIQLLAEYASNPSLRYSQSQSARQITIEQFDLTKMVKNYLDIYENLCLSERSP